MKVFFFILIILIILILILKQKKSFFGNELNKLLIITTDNRNDQWIKVHDKVFNKYAKKFNYKYLKMNNCDKSESTTYWCKIYKLKKYINENNYQYVMWADSDTTIINHDYNIYNIIQNHDKDIIIGVDDHDINILCAGLFIIKNSEIGKQFIDDCLSIIDSRTWCIKNNKEQGMWAGECYEQGVMNELLKNKYKNNVYIDYNSLFYNKINYNENFDYNNKKLFFLHLAGHSSSQRNAIMV